MVEHDSNDWLAGLGKMKNEIQHGSTRPRAVLCLSGGMDSTVCATLAARAPVAHALPACTNLRLPTRAAPVSVVLQAA